MGRLTSQTLDRTEEYADRILDVVKELEHRRSYARIIDQISGSGTSAGANAFEADEAMTAKDFAKCLGIVVKELNETRFWLRLVSRRGWIKTIRLTPLIQETLTLKSVFGAMIVRTRRKLAQSRTPRSKHT